MSVLRVVILGAERVGKSAVAVRFLTGRFIGDYNSDIDLLYRSSIRQEDYITELEILDTCSRATVKGSYLCSTWLVDGVSPSVFRCTSTCHGSATRYRSEMEMQHEATQLDSHVQWADAFVVVYDICNRNSFVKARDLLETLHEKKCPFLVPVLLTGNKEDLDHRREVGVDEGHEMALELSCQFYELSAADAFMPINIAFQALLRDAKITQSHRSTILRRRRSSLLTMSKKLGSIFGKKEHENDKKRPSCELPNFALSI